MKIRRFFASNIREAIRNVREEMGPDAVILSNRPVSDGVEIVVAVDYDESLFRMGGNAAAKLLNSAAAGVGPVPAPGAPAKPPSRGKASIKGPELQAQTTAEPPPSAPSMVTAPASPKVSWLKDPALMEVQNEVKSLRSLVEQHLCGFAWGDTVRRQPHRAGLLRRLLDYGLSPTVSRQLADRLTDASDLDEAWHRALALLRTRVRVTDDDILTNGGTVALVGPTGVGKTTTVAKLATRYTLRHGPRRVALVTTDSYRIGGHEQLRTLGRILDIPVRLAADETELRSTLEALSDKGLVLIDTAGMSQRDVRLTQQLAMVMSGAAKVRAYLVVAATTQRSGLQEIVEAFQDVALSGCIVTKLDEAPSLGGLLSVIIDKQLPVAYVTDGQRVPEDLAPARADTLVNQGVTLMQPASKNYEEEILALAFGGMMANASL